MPPITPLVVSYTPMPPKPLPSSSVSTWSKTPVGIAVITGSALAAVGLVALVVHSFRN